jgi:catechol 2,3-dioxygenase-like lactoylglutathione lyase family enzyme
MAEQSRCGHRRRAREAPWSHTGITGAGTGQCTDRGVPRANRSRADATVEANTSQEATMSTPVMSERDAATSVGNVDMKLEVVAIPVSDVDRAKAFYARLGWRIDADIARGDAFRIVQITPPGSSCSIAFGTGVSTAEPGSARTLELIVSDIDAARDQLLARGVESIEVFHGSPWARIAGPDPERQSYRTYAAFADPDGNEWLLQEVTARLPGRIDPGQPTFSSASGLAAALRRADAAHREHERRTGTRDANWPDWYAAYAVAEQAGEPLAS